MTLQNILSRRKLLVTALVGLGVTLALFGIASAQQTEQVNLSISPQNIELSVNPGDTTVDTIRITNNSAEAVQITAESFDIQPQGEEGSYIPIEATGESFSLSSWISLVPDGAIIPPRDTQDFELTITFPADAEPGGHYATAVFTTVPPPSQGEGASATVQQELALPVILAKVSGDIVESADLVEFKAAKSFYTNEDQIEFETRLNNTGNVHVKPKGTIVIKNMFGSEVATIDVDSNNVLPEYVRQLGAVWEDPGFAWGRYTADLSMVFGNSDQIITASTSFTVFPYQTIIPAAILVGALLYVLIRYRDRFGMALKVLTGRN